VDWVDSLPGVRGRLAWPPPDAIAACALLAISGFEIDAHHIFPGMAERAESDEAAIRAHRAAGFGIPDVDARFAIEDGSHRSECEVSERQTSAANLIAVIERPVIGHIAAADVEAQAVFRAIAVEGDAQHAVADKGARIELRGQGFRNRIQPFEKLRPVDAVFNFGVSGNRVLEQADG
jgi:hypothetical protein